MIGRSIRSCKCILLVYGVFGHPAVAVAIDQGVTVNISESNKWILDGQEFSPRTSTHFIQSMNYSIIKVDH